MTKKEREEFKKEIVAEVLAELKHQNRGPQLGQYNYDQYRYDVVQDDLKKVKTFLDQKKRWTWFIPLFGIYFYAYQVLQLFNSLDRGAMRVALTKHQMRHGLWYVLLWIVCLPLVINVQPFLDFHVFTKAASEVDTDLEQNPRGL